MENKCKWFFEHVPFLAEGTIGRVASSLQYMNGDRRNAYEDIDNHSVKQSWSAPTPGMVKINVDASVRSSNSCAAAICRNSQSRVLRVAATSISTMDSKLAEAHSILLDLKLEME